MRNWVKWLLALCVSGMFALAGCGVYELSLESSSMLTQSSSSASSAKSIEESRDKLLHNTATDVSTVSKASDGSGNIAATAVTSAGLPVTYTEGTDEIVYNTATDVSTVSKVDGSWGGNITVTAVTAADLPVVYTGDEANFLKIEGLYGNKIAIAPEMEASAYEALKDKGYIVAFDYLLYTNGYAYPAMVLPSGQQQTKGDEWCTRGDGSRIGFAANTEGANNTLYLDDLLDGTTTHVFYTYDTSTNYANWVLYVGNFRIVDPTTGEQIAPPPAVEEDSSEVESSEEESSEEGTDEIVYNTATDVSTASKVDGSWGGNITVTAVTSADLPVVYTGDAANFLKIEGLYGNKIAIAPEMEASAYEALKEKGYIVAFDYLLYTNGYAYPAMVLPSGQQQTKGDEWCTRGDGSRIGFAANTEGANNTLYLDDLLDGTTTHVFYTYDTSTNYANWVLYVGNFRIVDPTTGEQIAPPPAVEEDSSEVESSEEEVLVPLVWNAVNNTATLVRADTSYGATTLNIEIVNASNVPVTYTGAGTKFYKIVGTSLYGNKIFFNADYEESYYDAYRGNGYIVTYDYLLYTNGVTHPTYVLSSGNQQMDWDVWRTRGNGSELRTWTSASGTAGEYNTYYLDDLLDDPTLMYFYTYDERSTGYTLYVGNFRIVDPTTGEDVLVPGESGEVTPPVEESSDVVESSSEVIESSEVVESSETTTIREWAWHDINEEATDAIYYCNNQDKSDVWGEVKYVSAIGGRTGVYRVWAATCYEQVCGMVALPKYEKSYYENLVALDASATLEIDFYYEEGSFVHTQKNGTYNAGGSSAFTANTWHTISIPFSTILTNWDYITGATAASSSTKLILFGTYGATAPFVYYLDGFRIVTTAEEPEVEVSVEESSSQEEVPVPDWTEYGVNDGNVNVWTASGSEKFIQGVDYSDRYANTTLKLAAFQNEKESAQIIMTPSVAVEYYYLIPSTLSTARGNLLNVSNIEIYHQKYMQITTIKSSNWPEGPGWYPDALLPQDAAVRYEENTIALGMNKGIWITFDIPEQQEAGVYTGTFELVVDEQSYLVPVELTVYNYAVSEEQKLINALSLNYSDVANFEGYASAQELPVEIKEAYYEFLLDNGGSRPGGLPYEWNSSYGVVYGSATYDPSRLFEEGYEVNVQYHEIKIRNYIECIAKYAEDPRVAAYPMLIESEAAVNYDGEGNNTNVTNKLALKRVIEEMYQYSMANGVDLFKKVTLYLSWIDEFDGSSVTKRKSAQYNLAYMDTFFQEAATYLAGKADEYPLGAGVSESFRAEVLDSLSKIYIVCTAMGVTMLDPETQSMVFCPTIDKYHTEAGREAVDAWAEATGIGVKWAYLADNPQPPYSTYHIDDYLISSRMYNWMLYEYDISGTLYWGTVLSWDASLGQDYVVDDFYANPLRYPTANGDGFLMYPGNVYGVSGPVGSVRLQSIRDGMEDYNLLYDLEEFMKDRAADKGVDYNGDSFNTILRSLVDTLYRGTTCTYTSTYVNDFEATRKALASLLTLASEQGVVVENCQIAGDNAVFTVSAPSTATVEFNGVVTSQTANGITTYTVTLGKDDALSIVSGDYSLTMNAYSEVEVYNTWNDITAEETSNGTIYENARYYVNNGASHTTVNGDNPSTNGPISVVTLTEETAVGGRTEGTYYYIDPVANEVQDHGFMLLPKEEKSFYEETYSDSALLKFDVYFDMHGEYTDGMRLYTLLGQVGNQQKTSREWYTFEIDLDVIFEYWDTFHNPTSSDGLRRIALFGISGTRGSVVGEIFFYIGNFRIEQ